MFIHWGDVAPSLKGGETRGRVETTPWLLPESAGQGGVGFVRGVALCRCKQRSTSLLEVWNFTNRGVLKCEGVSVTRLMNLAVVECTGQGGFWKHFLQLLEGDVPLGD